MSDIYALTIPALKRGLAIMDAYVDKAAAYAESRGVAAKVLFDARLASDMLSFSAQVQRVSDNAKNGAARLAGVTPPSFADDESNFAELKARIAKTVAYLDSLQPEQFADAAERSIHVKSRTFDATMTGDSYLKTFLLPNYYFHITTAHGILRHNGVPIGKTDYLSSLG